MARTTVQGLQRILIFAIMPADNLCGTCMEQIKVLHIYFLYLAGVGLFLLLRQDVLQLGCVRKSLT